MSTIMLHLARSRPTAFRRGIQLRFLATETGEPKGTPYSKLTVGIPKETYPLERRVAATPESIQRLVKPGFSVLVEMDAGEQAHFSNADYELSGAKVVPKDALWKDSDIVLKVRAKVE